MDPEKTRRAIFGDLASENVPLGNTWWPLYRGTPFS
jgi:hypothetical protein